VQFEVGGPEFGVVVVAVAAESLGDGASVGDAPAGGGSVAFPGGDDGQDEVHCAVEGQ
jgi:hypothetical protein